jgi:hypothetical protein
MFSFKPGDEFFAFVLGAGGDRTSAHHEEIGFVVAFGRLPTVGEESRFIVQRFRAAQSAAEGYKFRFHVRRFQRTPVAEEMIW